MVLDEPQEMADRPVAQTPQFPYKLRRLSGSITVKIIRIDREGGQIDIGKLDITFQPGSNVESQLTVSEGLISGELRGRSE